MGFSENDLPRFDVTFGQVKAVEPSIEDRPLTAAERRAVDALLAAAEVWDEALDSDTVPELAPSPDADASETGERELSPTS